jgi:hypothetical protein
MVNIHIQNKNLYLIAVIFMFLVGSGIVVAYNPNWRTTPGNPAVMGHTIDEIDSEGLNMTIRAIVQEEIGGIDESQLTCSSSPIAETGVTFSQSSYKYLVIDIPLTFISPDSGIIQPNCTTNNADEIGACMIKEVIIGKNGPLKTQYCNYYQNSSSNVWTCLDSGRSGKNGDGTYTHILPESGKIWLRDDYYNGCGGCTKEKDKTKWALTDMDTTRGVKIYICVKDTL